ncbi:MAG: PDZ domain-containing protein, partial [Planctomycetaceae bacterium]
MPATENVWRSLPVMHRVFAVSSLALLGATLLMFRSDYADEWRKIQSVNYKLQTRLIDTDLAQLTDAQFADKNSQLEANLASATQLVADRKQELESATADASKVDGEFQKLSQEVRFKRAERDVRRAAYDLAVRDQLPVAQTRPLREQFVEAQALVDDLEAKLQELEGRFAGVLARKAQLTKERDAAATDLKKHRFDRDRLVAAREKIAPTGAMAFKRWLMELPVVEGFNGPLKINQIWLPKLEINYGGMTNVARFDRCTTCHLNIDRVGAGNVPTFPHDPQGISPSNADDYLSGKLKRVREDGSVVGYAHPYSTHPRPDLYLTSASPHSLQKFGCTGCHEGCGSGTSFQNASHSPNSPDVAQSWAKKYGYAANHYWEYPMFPKRLAEAACLKCHHNVVELGTNPKFGATAPKLVEGYQLISEYGCFGCHEINGYNAGKPIGPDLRLEPQTPEEADRIAGDPTAVAGSMRKVGPGLRHFAAKATRGWAEGWVRNPKEFRPATKMPQFFHLTNLKDGAARMLQPVEIAGIVEYLLAKSQPLEIDEWAADYEPSAERGRVLFAQRGCLACHSHEEFPGSKADFGPDLTQVHKKIPSAKWLYSWVRNPARHSERTRMPNLYLEPEVVQGTTVDPAADIAAWLLAKGAEEYPETKLSVFLGADLDKRFSAESARRLKLAELRGVRVTAVVPQSPAARATAVTAFSNEIIRKGKDDLVVDKPGLQPDDVILTWNGDPVSAPADVEQRLAGSTEGTEVELSIWREGVERRVRVSLAKPITALARMNLAKV